MIHQDEGGKTLIFAGIDVGGTATKCLLVSEDNQVLAEVKTGPANYQVVGLEKAVAEIKQAVENACRVADIAEIDILGIGLAGAGREQDIQAFKKVLSCQLEKVKQLYITDDGEIAVMGAHAGNPGLVVIAGTGSMVYGLSRTGQTIRAGGWGPILGDEGSGFWIGLMALKQIIKAEEGRGMTTSLVKPVLNEFNISNLWQELVPFIYQQRLPRKKIASLAPLVIKEMEAGDQIAKKIILTGIKELASTVYSISERLNEQEIEVAVSGGLFSNSFIYEEFSRILTGTAEGYGIFERKTQHGYQYRVIRPKFQPVYGAILLALKSTGYAIADFLD